MTVARIDRVGGGALMLAGLLAFATNAGAQAAVGSGPLTSTLADTEPVTGVLSVGPVKLAPGIVIREMGWDSNVFDDTEAEGPKSDFVLAATPDVAAFSRLRFFKVSAYAGSELTYYHNYQSEQSIGHAVRGRVDVLLSRVRPFFGAGQTKTRTRPNGEITARANRTDEELSGGIAFELGPHSSVYGATIRTKNTFKDTIEEHVDLGQSLTREGVEYSAGVRTDLTPLAALVVTGGLREDRFPFMPLRNAETRLAGATLKLDAAALVSGAVTIAYNDFNAVDPLVKPFKGITGSVALAYSLLEVGRLALIATRGQEYSFDAAEAYYLQNAVTLVYNHRLFGAVDAQVRGGRALFKYGFREGSPPHTDTLDTVEGGVGYNLKNRTRVSFNYEYARRRSPALADRNYDRRRVFLAWTVAF
jgi:hypothetical protein